MSAPLVGILVLLVLGFIAILLWRSFRPTLTNPMSHANNLKTKMKVHAQTLITEISKIVDRQLHLEAPPATRSDHVHRPDSRHRIVLISNPRCS
ncbi:hypothetical protein TFLX_06330 [Thermoflexales bacterium]|nr:hypothetical protein TFLX_06330 [Thermoflexales bacterium]